MSSGESEMRSPNLATAAVALGLFTIATGHAAQNDQEPSITQLPYPEAVSLVQERAGLTYRESAANLPLYLYEPRLPVTSVCNRACERQWIPLLAAAGEKPLGDWTIVVRQDGRRQWAFMRHPVYTHLGDVPGKASGHGVDSDWQLMPHFHS